MNKEKMIWACEKCPRYRAGTNVCCCECNEDGAYCGGVEPIKQVLWLSRHEMTPDQLMALSDAYGEIDILQINKTFDNVQELKPYIEEFDVLAVVLPLEMVAELLAMTEKPVIYAVNGREFTADGKAEFVFKGWRRYKNVVIETAEI